MDFANSDPVRTTLQHWSLVYTLASSRNRTQWPYLSTSDLLLTTCCLTFSYKIFYSWISPPLILAFISNLISSRTLQFINQGTISDPRISHKGTPQGSVLSPTLFNIYLRKINDVLLPSVELLQFADDIVIFSSANDTMLVIQPVEQSLHNLGTFLGDRGLEISPQKTQLMIFSTKRPSIMPNYSIIYQDHLILPSSSLRFLGVLLDPKLSSSTHVLYITQKGKRILQIISALRGWWGAHPHMLLTIYRSMLRASRIFCSYFWNDESRTNTRTSSSPKSRSSALLWVSRFHPS